MATSSLQVCLRKLELICNKLENLDERKKEPRLYPLLEELLDNRFDLNTTFEDNNNLLMHLINMCDYDDLYKITKLFLSKGINIYHKNDEDETAEDMLNSYINSGFLLDENDMSENFKINTILELIHHYRTNKYTMNINYHTSFTDSDDESDV